MSAPTIIQILKIEQVDEALDTLVPAFMGDPIFNHYFPEENIRRRVFKLLFNDIIRTQIRAGTVYAALAGKRIAGVAVWKPPEPVEPNEEDHQRGEATLKELQELASDGIEKVLAGFEGLQAHHPQEPHWYLMFVGVHPDNQRRGLGAAMLGHVHQIADQQGRPCYLETPFPETRAFYRALGYEVIQEMNAFGDAPALWTLLRKAS